MDLVKREPCAECQGEGGEWVPDPSVGPGWTFCQPCAGTGLAEPGPDDLLVTIPPPPD